MRLLLPEITFPPAADRQLCVYLTLENDEPLWIERFDAHQGPSGHHLVAFTTLEDEPDGTIVDCSSAERMPFWRLLFATKSKGEPFTFAPGYAVKIEPRARIVLQVHYVNASLEPIVTQDALDLTAYSGATAPIPVAPFAFGSAGFEIPPRAEYTGTYECVLDRDINVTLALGHMHEHGRSIEVLAGPKGGLQRVYGIDRWTVEYRDQAPFVEWPASAPLILRAGDLVQVVCSWRSHSDEVINFPEEMCAAVMWFFPAERPLTCIGKSLE